MAAPLLKVKSAQRVIEIFEMFARHRAPATLTAVASALSMPKSSCMALLKTLEANGYIYELRAQAGFYPTRRWLDQAQIITAHDPLVRTIRPAIVALRDATGETVIVAKLGMDRVVYIDVVEPTLTLRYSAAAGQFKPLHATASGKALLSALPQAERRALVARLKLAKVSPATIDSRAALEEEVEAGLKRGWQMS